MDGHNVTIVTVIYLLGLRIPQRLSLLVFILLFFISVVTIGGNLLIILLVSYSKTLHCPMYFFLSQLSLSDLLLSSDILPILLHTILVKETRLSFSACMTQFFFFSTSEGVECLLLTVMSYDRYLAICRPLHYRLIMNHGVFAIIVITVWTSSIIMVLSYVFSMLRLQYCGANVIDHFFCDFSPILELSCSDTSKFQLAVTLLSQVFFIIPLLYIVISYVSIAFAIFKIPSNTGRQKAFSTCSSHLTVVSICYGSLICVYMVPNQGKPQDISKFLALLYTVITPLMNPIVYSLRNKDLKISGEKLFTNLFNLKFQKY